MHIQQVLLGMIDNLDVTIRPRELELLNGQISPELFLALYYSDSGIKCLRGWMDTRNSSVFIFFLLRDGGGEGGDQGSNTEAHKYQIITCLAPAFCNCKKRVYHPKIDPFSIGPTHISYLFMFQHIVYVVVMLKKQLYRELVASFRAVKTFFFPVWHHRRFSPVRKM
jgi:hypothetical protein